MRNRVHFRALRTLLLEVGFTEQHAVGSHFRFAHAASGLVFVLPEYGSEDLVHPAYVFTTRMQLDAKRLLDASEFDRRWLEASA